MIIFFLKKLAHVPLGLDMLSLTPCVSACVGMRVAGGEGGEIENRGNKGERGGEKEKKRKGKKKKARLLLLFYRGIIQVSFFVVLTADIAFCSFEGKFQFLDYTLIYMMKYLVSARGVSISERSAESC